MSPPARDDDDEAGETAPAPLFEQEQAVVSGLARSVRLWRTLARMRSLGLPGTEEVRVGRFVLEDVLGEGGMSVVFAARDPELGQRVALKMLNQAMHAAQATRLLREGQALAKIKSDHVIKVLEIGRYEEAMYLALERVEGVSLDQWLKAQRPAPSGILDLMIQAARGLAAAHMEGLVHRDVKPQNIMVAAPAAAGAAPRVYVVDFGLVSASVNAAAGDGDAGRGSRSRRG
jgi:serine/threonine protein kinase